MTTTHSKCGPEVSGALMKRLHRQWATVREMAEEAGISLKAAARWAREWNALGIIKSRRGQQRTRTRGPIPAEHTLGSKWGGL